MKATTILYFLTAIAIPEEYRRSHFSLFSLQKQAVTISGILLPQAIA
jgi:hypothetical protein